MLNFIAGFILGFFVATTGLTGVAKSIDSVIEKIKTTSITVDSK